MPLWKVLFWCKQRFDETTKASAETTKLVRELTKASAETTNPVREATKACAEATKTSTETTKPPKKQSQPPRTPVYAKLETPYPKGTDA